MNYRQSAADIAAELGSDVKNGLSIEKAHERIHSRGRNVIRTPKVKSTFARFRRRLLSLMNVVLILMAVVHIADDGVDGIPISVCFVACAIVNAAVGYISFRRESAVISAVNSAQNQSVRVVRSGIVKTSSATLLAQGDVCLLEKGQTVPADAKIIECESLVVDESMISGDNSMATKSARIGMEDESVTALYMGTKIIDGSARAIVTDVGDKTQLGAAVAMLGSGAEKASAFAERIAAVCTLCGAASAVMWAAALIFRLAGGYGLVSAFDNSIAAAVTALPVSLSAVLLITMSADILSLKKRGTLVGSTSALEAMGSSTALCVGKRGFMTELGFGVGEVRPRAGFDENSLRLLAAMCTTADINEDGPRGDVMQVALIRDALNNGITVDDIRGKAPLETVLDNRSSKHIMTTVHRTDQGYTVITKGSADAALGCCSYIYDNGTRLIDPRKDPAEIITEARAMAEKSLTVIGVAFKDVRDLGGDLESGMTFVGLVGLRNPVRKDTPAAIRSLNSMGVKLCVITDDSLTGSAAMAEECGLDRASVLRAAEAAEFSRLYKNTVFADTPPSDKAEIVARIASGRENVIAAGRSSKDIDAMSRGDVSLSTGVSATICVSASDVHVGGSGLSRIAAAIRECKRTYINNERIIGYLLSCNAAEMLCAVVSLLMGYSIPFTPAAVIWLNAVVATVGAVAVWREPYHRRRESRRQPRSGSKGGLSRSMLLGAAAKGTVIGAAAMTLYASTAGAFDVADRRSAVFISLCAAFTLMAQSRRSEGFMFSGLTKNKIAPVCFMLGILAIAAVVCTPLGPALGVSGTRAFAAAVAAGIVPVALMELYKLFRRKDLWKTKKTKSRKKQSRYPT